VARFSSSKKSFPSSPSKMRGPVSWLSLGLIACAGVGLSLFYEIEKERKIVNPASVSNVTTTGKPAIGGPWVLVDQDGKGVTDATYRGEFLLLYFGFTHCPDICPSELVKVGNIVKELERRKSMPVKPVFISVDPHRDTIRQLKHYSQDFSKAFTFLTGTPDQIAKVTRAYRVYYSKADEVEDDDEDYLVDHSIVLYLVDPEGEFQEFYTQKMEVSDIVDRITKQIATWKTRKL